MEIINDIEITDRLVSVERKRFEYFIPNYLVKLIGKSRTVCSAGCGMAYDVEKLNALGYDAYGFDPGNRTKVWHEQLSPQTYKKLTIAAAGDPVLDEFNKYFDYVYALEVIEHVGTSDGVWQLKNNHIEERVKFMESCMDMLRMNGKLLITTSNRLCPIDLGHGHHYNPITDFFTKKLNIKLTIPFSKKNFVCSYSDVKKYLDLSNYKDRYTMRPIDTVNYSSNSKAGRSKLIYSLFKAYLRVANAVGRTSFLNPILSVEITKSK